MKIKETNFQDCLIQGQSVVDKIKKFIDLIDVGNSKKNYDINTRADIKGCKGLSSMYDNKFIYFEVISCLRSEKVLEWIEKIKNNETPYFIQKDISGWSLDFSDKRNILFAHFDDEENGNGILIPRIYFKEILNYIINEGPKIGMFISIKEDNSLIFSTDPNSKIKDNYVYTPIPMPKISSDIWKEKCVLISSTSKKNSSKFYSVTYKVSLKDLDYMRKKYPMRYSYIEFRGNSLEIKGEK